MLESFDAISSALISHLLFDGCLIGSVWMAQAIRLSATTGHCLEQFGCECSAVVVGLVEQAVAHR